MADSDAPSLYLKICSAEPGTGQVTEAPVGCGSFQTACPGSAECASCSEQKTEHSWFIWCKGNTGETYDRWKVSGTTKNQIRPHTLWYTPGCLHLGDSYCCALPQVWKPQPHPSVRLSSASLPPPHPAGALQGHPMHAANNPESFQ